MSDVARSVLIFGTTGSADEHASPSDEPDVEGSPHLHEVAALVALAALTAGLVGLVTWESWRTRVRRAEIKAGL